MTGGREIHGIAARFADRDALLTAVRQARAAGYEHVEAHAPAAEPEIERALGESGNAVAWIATAAGVVCALAAYALQYYAAVVDFPFNAGGRPLHAWPPFLVVAFAVGLLGAVLATGIALFVQNGFPAYYHPIFHVDGFVAGEGYVLVVASSDSGFERDATRNFLDRLGPVAVQEVPR
ncbi:DUF3341 domain-containing protein [Minwuia thermotolerans]|uniref:DUF3341 domain-containing protein n=1 Tax=Minwuia thermotolerans TaxID=2056226 RepID=A0A2M9G325_9PROT|nr:DUF3341 domain-containing protein [Minwuia thermotolerans]PJK30105.1 hypothetical protein CVT23_10130 [Minwuia thermotolerans]